MVRRLTASLLETWPKTLQNRTPCRSGLHRNAKFSTHAVVAERADGWRVGYFSDSSITDASLHTFENVPSSALTLVEHDGVQEHTGETQLHGQRVRKSNMFFQAKTPSVLGFEQTKEHVTLLHEKLAQAESVSPLHRHVRHITIDSPAARSRYNSTWRRLTRHINRQCKELWFTSCFFLSRVFCSAHFYRVRCPASSCSLPCTARILGL